MRDNLAHRWSRGPAIAVCLMAACGRSGKPEPAGQLSPPARAIQIATDSVVLEGRWQPIDSGAPSGPDSVKVRCARAERRCREELTTTHPGQAAKTVTFQYAVREWTKAKLVAARAASGSEVELRVAFTAAAAEKVVIEKRSGKTIETRWRLD